MHNDIPVANAVVSLQNVCVKYDELNAVAPLNNINLDIYQGEFVCVLGLKGCGKSSLLNIIAGKLTPDGGRAFLSGERITHSSFENPFIFNPPVLMPWIDLKLELEIPLRVNKNYNEETISLLNHYIELFELEEYLEKKYYEIPEDAKFMASLAQAMLGMPKVVVIDDPFFHFDPIIRMKVQKKLKKIFNEIQVPIVFGTRNIDEALRLATRIVIMSKKGGEIINQILVNENLAPEVINQMRSKIYSSFLSE